MGSRKFPSLWSKPLGGIPAPQTVKRVSRGFEVRGSPHYFGVLAAGAPQISCLGGGTHCPQFSDPLFGGGSVRGDGDKLALARGICASGTVCGGRHMAVVIPCVPNITIHVSQPGVVSRCCCPCPVSGVTRIVTSARGHACFPPPPPCCSPLLGVLTQLLSPAVGMYPPSWGCCAGSIPVPWGAPLGALRCPGGLCHGGLHRGTVPAAVGREPGCAAGTEPGTAGVTPVTS